MTLSEYVDTSVPTAVAVTIGRCAMRARSRSLPSTRHRRRAVVGSRSVRGTFTSARNVASVAGKPSAPTISRRLRRNSPRANASGRCPRHERPSRKWSAWPSNHASAAPSSVAQSSSAAVDDDTRRYIPHAPCGQRTSSSCSDRGMCSKKRRRFARRRTKYGRIGTGPPASSVRSSPNAVGRSNGNVRRPTQWAGPSSAVVHTRAGSGRIAYARWFVNSK